jgi:hypothetical protein
MKLKMLLLIVLLLLVLVLVPINDVVFEWIGLDSTLSAEVLDFRVNTDLGSAFQAYSNITSDADGNFIVTWYDSRYTDYDIFGQRFLHDGTRVGSNFRINDDSDSDEQYYPRVTTDEAGRFVVVWQDYRVTGYPMNSDIFGQRYNSNGTKAGVNYIVNDDGASVSQRAEDIDCDDFGNYVVVFSDLRDGVYNIYCQRYHYSGTTLGGNVMVNNDCCSNPHHSPRVAVDADGDFVVVWYDQRFGNDDIFFQRFNSSGEVQGANTKVNSQGDAAKQVFPDVSCDMYCSFVVAWTDYRNGTYPGNPDIYFQRFDSDGNTIGANTRVGTDGTDASQSETAVAMDFFGNFIVAWTDERDPGSTDIWAQYYNSAGEPIGLDYRVNSDSSDARQSAPHVTMDGVNIYYTWTDERAGDFDIYAKVTEYAAPAILINPAGLDFQVEFNVPSSETKPISIDNTGQGILSFGVEPSESWISISADSGIAPDTIYVGINHSGIGYGYFEGSILISDLSGGDSSRTCAITLLVEAPVIDLSADTLEFTGFLGDTVTLAEVFTISNAGTGDLNWSISAGEDWIEFDPTSGSAPSSVDIAVSPVGLDKGIYYSTVTISSLDAVNSPQILVLKLEVRGGRPYLELIPDTIHSTAYHLAGMNAPETLIVRNLGDEPSTWTASSSAPWVTLLPMVGVDSAVIEVTADAVNFETGTYYSDLTIADINAYNNPQHSIFELEILPVPAHLIVSADSLHIQYLFDTDSIPVGTIDISNSGEVPMDWSIDFDTVLVDVEPSAGIDNASVTVHPRVDSLSPGLYQTWLVVESDSADNSPDSVKLIIDIADNPPKIALFPEQLTVELRNPGDTSVPCEVTIANAGAYTLNWNAISNRDWITVEPDSGVADDTATVSVDFSLLELGWNLGNVIFEDLEAVNSPQSLYVSVQLAPDDTLIIQPANSTLGEDFLQAVELVSFLKLRQLNIPLQVRSPDVSIESVYVNQDRTSTDVTGSVETDSSGQRGYVNIEAGTDGFVSPGSGTLFTLYCSTDLAGAEGVVFVDTFYSETNPFLAVDTYGDTAVPYIEAGMVYLGPTTSAGEIRQLEQEGELSLHQNHPNPFNSATSIAFSISGRGEVTLELFNILGQKICDMYRGYLGTGLFEIDVSGSVDHLASGIYFYRLKYEDRSLVKKMVVLK